MTRRWLIRPVMSRHVAVCRGMCREGNINTIRLPCIGNSVAGYATPFSGYGALVRHRCSTSRRASMTENCHKTAMRHWTLQLARPAAWTFVPPCGCILFGLACAVAFSAVRVRRTFHLDGACLAVGRRWAWHAVLSDVLITPAAGKSYWPWHAWHNTLSVCVTVLYARTPKT
jgi:hypothetical protein